MIIKIISQNIKVTTFLKLNSNQRFFIKVEESRTI